MPLNIAGILMRADFRSRVTQELLDWHNTRNTNLELVLTETGEVLDRDDTCTCERCSEIERDTVCVSVFTSTRNRRQSEEIWCESCARSHSFECADCSSRYDDDLSSGTNCDGDTVCESCAESYFVCEGCNCVCHNDNYGSDGYCCDCESRDDDEETIIREYSADAPLRFHGRGPHYYGVELEVESSDVGAHSQTVNDLVSNFAILKHDGSLENGFEIVTHPCTLEEQRKLWTPFFQHKPAGLKSFETTTCGLHVHCSRAPLTELTIAKIVCFVNAAHNRKFLEVIAGRAIGRWATYHAKKLSDGNKRNPQRYEAVNLQNHGTIEFRIFKGTLKKESVFKAIEFCDALIRFCQPASRSLTDSLSRVRFCEFVARNHKTWPHLSAFISSRWFGIETKDSKAFNFPTSPNRQVLTPNEQTKGEQ